MAANEDEFAAYKDLARVPQDDGPSPVVAINYNANFVIAHDYFRAILQKNEISERGLDISTKVIGLNSANYTAWQYRRECLFKLESNLYDELSFSEQIAHKSPKNYQLWWHRRIIIDGILSNQLKQESSKDSDCGAIKSINGTDYSMGYDLFKEKDLIRDILSEDSKNYHAWSHLHWLLRTYGFNNKKINKNDNDKNDENKESSGNDNDSNNNNSMNMIFDESDLVRDELDYCDELLKADVRNNSAWNHRHFIVKTALSFENLNVCKNEIKYCQNKLDRLAKNDSIWYYYSDITLNQLANAMKNEINNKNNQSNNKNDKNDANNIETQFNKEWEEWKNEEIKFIQKLLEKQPYCARAMLYYVDLLNDKNTQTIKDNDLNDAINLLDLLGNKMDRVRVNYYNYLKQEIQNKKTQLEKK